MPFITEEIFCTLHPEEETIMLSEWPTYQDAWNFPEAEDAIEKVKLLAKGVRNLRAEMDVPPSRKAKCCMVSEDENLLAVYDSLKENYSHFFGCLLYTSRCV